MKRLYLHQPITRAAFLRILTVGLCVTALLSSCATTRSGSSAKATINGEDSIYEAIRQEMIQSNKKVLPPMRRHELSIGVGCGANQADHDTPSRPNEKPQIAYYWNDGECFDLFGNSYVYLNMEYHYRINRKWEIGGLGTWGISNENYFANYTAEEEKTTADWDLMGNISRYESCRYFTVMPSVRYTWYESDLARVYSRGAIGLMRHHITSYTEDYAPIESETVKRKVIIEDEDRVKYGMAYHITVLGVRLGKDWLGAFGEIGYGCLGVVRVGLNVCF